MNVPDAQGASPRLSVVIAAWTGPESLARCMSSILPQLDPAHDELIVARNFTPAPASGPPPAVRVVDLSLPSTHTVPQLRSEGVGTASGDIIAFLEDHCLCDAGWREALMAMYALAQADAVGGPVDLAAGGSALDWAVYFYDYAAYAPPVPPGPPTALSGANMSFRRALLEAMLPERVEVHEAALTAWMRSHDVRMALADRAVVVHDKRHRAVRTVLLTFALARSFAAARFPRLSPRRAVYAAGSMVLPLLLGARIVLSVFRAPRLAMRFVASLGWLVLLLVSWAAGELTGYLMGAGTSGAQWR